MIFLKRDKTLEVDGVEIFRAKILKKHARMLPDPGRDIGQQRITKSYKIKKVIIRLTPLFSKHLHKHRRFMHFHINWKIDQKSIKNYVFKLSNYYQVYQREKSSRIMDSNRKMMHSASVN